MSQTALKSLLIEHLRGSVVPFTLPFDKGKKLTVVYGENGTGKSTISDAFDFLGNGRVGSLENRGLGKTTRYWHSLGKTSSDVSVTLETDDSKCAGTVHKSEVVCSPAEGRPRVEVLRRGQILALLEASPGDRYAAISRFIDVSAAEAAEASLRELIRQLQKNRDVAVARVQENQDSIRHFWTTAGEPAGDPLEWAAAESARDIKADDAEVRALSQLQFAFARLGDLPRRAAEARANAERAKDVFDKARLEEKRRIGEAAGGAGEVVEILLAALGYLHRHPQVPTCPLCESAEKAVGLAGRIEQRLTTFSDVQNAQAATKAAAKSLEAAELGLKNTADEVQHAVADFEKSRASSAWPADVKMPGTEAPSDSTQLQEWLNEHSFLPSEWDKAEAIRQDRRQFIGTLREAVRTCRDNTDAQTYLDRLLPTLARMLEIVAEERRAFTDNILSDIANCVGQLYEEVHPGEGLNKISLELDPKKRASLEIGASFAGQQAPPQAYFSDSHLDTLGLCVFLALAQRDDAADTILVLDDVLASVDEPHVDRLIETLYSQALKFRHCIITTHYRPWKQKLRWGWLKNGQCQFVELAKWTNSSGLTLIRSIPDVERLRHLMAETPPDEQLVCAKAGVILEAALDFLTQLYECSCPRRAGGLYTLGDLLPSVGKKLRNSLAVDVLEKNVDGALSYRRQSLTPYLDELTRIAQARNVFGCHFSDISFSLLSSDAIAFGEQVMLLMDALTDPNAGWPKNAKSGSYWTNSGDTRRLHPLKTPT